MQEALSLLSAAKPEIASQPLMQAVVSLLPGTPVLPLVLLWLLALTTAQSTQEVFSLLSAANPVSVLQRLT
jgi:hypothetical protein